MAPSVPRLALPTLQAEQSSAAKAQNSSLQLSLLSQAFEVAPQPQRQQHEQQQSWPADIAVRLGVEPYSRLRFFGLVEAPTPGDLPPGCTQVAVEVSDTGFSLKALESLLEKNLQLAAAHSKLLKDNAALRQQLASSERRRRKGTDALLALQAEFQQLSAELTEELACAGAQIECSSPAAVTSAAIKLQ